MAAIRFVLLSKPAVYKQPLRGFVTGLRTKGGDIGLRLNMADKGRANCLFSTKTAIDDNIEYDVPSAGAIKNKHSDRIPIVSNDTDKMFVALVP
jgi:hypothetical protein